MTLNINRAHQHTDSCGTWTTIDKKHIKNYTKPICTMPVMCKAHTYEWGNVASSCKIKQEKGVIISGASAATLTFIFQTCDNNDITNDLLIALPSTLVMKSRNTPENHEKQRRGLMIIHTVNMYNVWMSRCRDVFFFFLKGAEKQIFFFFLENWATMF